MYVNGECDSPMPILSKEDWHLDEKMNDLIDPISDWLMAQSCLGLELQELKFWQHNALCGNAKAKMPLYSSKLLAQMGRSKVQVQMDPRDYAQFVGDKMVFCNREKREWEWGAGWKDKSQWQWYLSDLRLNYLFCPILSLAWESRPKGSK